MESGLPLVALHLAIQVLKSPFRVGRGKQQDDLAEA